MKIILKEKALEEAQYFCDKHPDRECYTELRIMGWYGSKFDMMMGEVHLCDECMEEIIEMIEEKFKVKPKEIEI